MRNIGIILKRILISGLIFQTIFISMLIIDYLNYKKSNWYKFGFSYLEARSLGQFIDRVSKIK